jgi:hypothetical protein
MADENTAAPASQSRYRIDERFLPTDPKSRRHKPCKTANIRCQAAVTLLHFRLGVDPPALPSARIV